MNFQSFALQPALLKSLKELGYQTPTPIQAQTIPLLLKGHDVVGCAQTGTGKTAAFALPILEKLTSVKSTQPKPQALIITPTRELAEQIDQNIKAYAKHLKLSCLAVYGGVSINPQEARLRQGVNIVVATPGRLLDHLERQSLDLSHVRYLVLDEADRMLDMGFLPDIKRILKRVPKDRQTLLFSATMPKEIEELVKSLTYQAQYVNISPRNAAADTVTQKVYRVEKPNKLRLLLHLMQTQSMYSVIVFSRTRHGADRIARQLDKQGGIPVARIHADRSQNQRQQALEGFKKGKFQVLVATDIAARGIDIEEVTHVINFDTPTHPEDYVHRIGRTGRAQATGDAWTFTSPEEDKYLKGIEKLIGKPIPVVKSSEYQEFIQPAASAANSPSSSRQAEALQAPKAQTVKAETKAVGLKPKPEHKRDHKWAQLDEQNRKESKDLQERQQRRKSGKAGYSRQSDKPAAAKEGLKSGKGSLKQGKAFGSKDARSEKAAKPFAKQAQPITAKGKPLQTKHRDSGSSSAGQNSHRIKRQSPSRRQG